MDNKEQEKNIPSLEGDNDSFQSDNKFLIQKLKSIKEIINLIEKNFLEKKK